ncbi:hypothetical protein [Cryptosporangium sp. NPDC048952]|uniref:hypothetical protein n=1 Tax=Cryptosporangium sp. NPDC048952 TaxID=3363961 RepID=UPI00371054A8
MKLLFEASAPVRASLARVRALIDDEWVLDAFFASPDARSYVDVDHAPGVVGFQGHWWYRGEISASDDAGPTRMIYRVFNIAQRGAWAVPAANHFFVGYRRTVQEGVDGLAAAVERHLKAAA